MRFLSVRLLPVFVDLTVFIVPAVTLSIFVYSCGAMSNNQLASLSEIAAQGSLAEDSPSWERLEAGNNFVQEHINQN